MTRWASIVAVMVAGCGAQVATPGTGSETSGAGSSSTGAVPDETGSSSTGTPASSTGDGEGGGSSSSSTGSGPRTWCVREQRLENSSGLSRSQFVMTPEGPRIWMNYQANGEPDAFRIVQFTSFGTPDELLFEQVHAEGSVQLRAAVDIDGDGWPDAVTSADSSYQWQRGQPGHSIAAVAEPLPDLSTARFMDFNEDGRADAIHGIYSILTPAVGDGSGGFEFASPIELAPEGQLSATDTVLLPPSRFVASHCIDDDCGNGFQTDIVELTATGAESRRWTAVDELGVRQVLGRLGEEVLVVMWAWQDDGALRWLVPTERGGIDFVVVEPSGAGVFIDIDGDGFRDRLFADGDWELRLWDGEAFGDPEAVSGPIPSSSDDAVDIDGDGWSEMLGYETNENGGVISELIWSLVPCE